MNKPKAQSDILRHAESDNHGDENDRPSSPPSPLLDAPAEQRLKRKIDLRLCTIAAILYSLDLIDSGILSSASVTTIFHDLSLTSTRYSVSIFVFTLASISLQLFASSAVRWIGPRAFFAATTLAFGLITLCTAFVTTWRQLIAVRILQGFSVSGIFPGLTYLISVFYTRQEQQLRFAYLQTGEVIILATGNIVNYGLNHLHGRRGLAGWQWIFLVQGAITALIGLITYFWMVDLPEHSNESVKFLDPEETRLLLDRINRDRGDAEAPPFSWKKLLLNGRDVKVYGFAAMFFLQNLVSTALSYFLPIILQSGLHYSPNRAILLSTPPYYWAVLPVILSSLVGDRYRLRGPVIVFNSLCLIVGFGMLGFARDPVARYIGTFLATGAYVSNWAGLSAYYSNNIVGQWKRIFTAAVVTAFNGAGGIAGSFIVKQDEAPRYGTAVWVSIGSHAVMIALVGLFSLGFARANRRQAKGKKVIEGTPGFRHTY